VQKTLLFKAVIIAVLMFIICIPLLMIQGTIHERIAFRDQAVSSIAADSVREQTMIGPVLVLPYVEEYEEQVAIPDDKDGRTRIQKYALNKRLLVFPGELAIKSSIRTDQRYRGIHKVLVYSGQHAISGEFTLPANSALPRTRPGSTVTLKAPMVALSIEDVRGIRNIPTINWSGKRVEFEQGSGLNSFKSGLHATLATADVEQHARVTFSLDLGLDGIERLHIAPVGKNNHVELSSTWPHPQFGGRFLPSPETRVINEKGFNAQWNISSLATDAQNQLARLESLPERADGARTPTAELDYFSVGFIEPVNVYSQADRATKYGLLFVALTFASFFIFEILKRLPIHPVQYLLVGLALVLFFLLLVGLSEHIAFLLAYLIASAACIVLIGFYLSHVLRNWRRGAGFACALTLLYGAMYGLLSSENNALVLGSILLFAVLAAIMVATRKVDWYQIGKPDPASAPVYAD
jgi:inner membrane protein